MPAVVQKVPTWNEPGVTEQQLILENQIDHPGDNGGIKAVSLQRAGYLARLRLYSQLAIEQSAATGAPSKSAYGPFGSVVRRLRVEANGKIPLFAMSGIGAVVYNEVANRDGSLVSPPSVEAALNMTLAASLHAYTTPGTGAQSYSVKAPIELPFTVPMFIRGIARQYGLFLLQEQSIDLRVEVEFNKPLNAAAATPHAAYSGGTGLVGTTTLASSKIDIERELYSVPADPKSRPDESFAHQVIEYEQAITGKFCRFNYPASGIVLRTTMYMMDSNDAAVEWTDLDYGLIAYGSNVTPIRRPGWSPVQEYLQDYGRYPLKGVIPFDWYKAGQDTVRLAKNSEVLANFRVEVGMKTTTTGKILFLVDTLVPVTRYVAPS